MFHLSSFHLDSARVNTAACRASSEIWAASSHGVKNDVVDLVNRYMVEGLEHGLLQHSTADTTLDGRLLRLGERQVVNFASCSYLGLEQHPALVDGCIDAAQRYGSQLSSSRTYLSIGLYGELEELLTQIFRRPVLVSASTSLGHLGALPVLVRKGDAVILDHQVHASVQTAAQLLRAKGIPVHPVRHNDLAGLEKKIRELEAEHGRIWYMADGVYSMYGDLAPMEQLVEMLDVHDKLFLYLDDAHGMSWIGEHGAGCVRSQVEHHPKMVLAVSLNKAFACAGGALVFPNPEIAGLVRNCGGTFIFSGPIQPPMLGAAIASAKLHLSPGFAAIQRELKDLVCHTNRRMEDLGLPQVETTAGPLFFVPVGLPRVVRSLVGHMLEDGFFMNPASFPATPMRRGGLRFTINRNLQVADIDAMLDRLAHHYPRVLAREGADLSSVACAFDIPVPQLAGSRGTKDGSAIHLPQSLTRRNFTPHSIAPQSPNPHCPTPHSPTPHSPTPHSPTPHSPTPHSPTLHSPTPQDSATRIAATGRARSAVVLPRSRASRLEVEVVRQVADVDAVRWDALFSGRGNFTHAGLKLLEEIFSTQADPEERWEFFYLFVRETGGQVILATFYTCARTKDDMLSTSGVSRKVEQRRREQPDYLTSKTVMTGCLISKGEHIFLDTRHPQWRGAVRILVEQMQETAARHGARTLALGEFHGAARPRLEAVLRDLGLVELELPSTCVMDDLTWPDHDAYLGRLGGRYRYSVRKEILAYRSRFVVRYDRPTTHEEVRQCYALYRQVHARSFEINVDPLPLAFFEGMCAHPSYDVLRLELAEDPRPSEERGPVGVLFSFLGGGTYSALLVGLDDFHRLEHNVYKQVLYQAVQRAWSLGCKTLDLAYTAALEKKKVGALPRPSKAYVQIEDTYTQALLDSLAA